MLHPENRPFPGQTSHIERPVGQKSIADGAWDKDFGARKKAEGQIVSEIEAYTHEVAVDSITVSEM